MLSSWTSAMNALDASGSDTRASARARRLSLAASIFVGTIGALVLLGWVFHIDRTWMAAGVTLEVSDTGIGFDDAFAQQLFQPFRQADSSSRREHGGLGLGLSIARHIVELHGGTIAGASDGPGRGARFVVTLPPLDAGIVPASPPAARASELGV